MEHRNSECPKCSNRNYEVDEVSATSGGISRFFNVQNKRFSAVVCSKCSYTEFYRTPSSRLSNVLDFFGN